MARLLAEAPGCPLPLPVPSDEALAWAAAESAAARTAGASAVVLAAHYGPNWELRPPPEVRSFARAVVANTDVDVFLGTSAHVAQGVEVHAGRAIIYQVRASASVILFSLFSPSNALFHRYAARRATSSTTTRATRSGTTSGARSSRCPWS